MAVRPTHALRRTPQQITELQRNIERSMREMTIELWLEEIAWRMYGVDVTWFQDEQLVDVSRL